MWFGLFDRIDWLYVVVCCCWLIFPLKWQSVLNFMCILCVTKPGPINKFSKILSENNWNRWNCEKDPTKQQQEKHTHTHQNRPYKKYIVTYKKKKIICNTFKVHHIDKNTNEEQSSINKTHIHDNIKELLVSVNYMQYFECRVLHFEYHIEWEVKEKPNETKQTKQNKK